MSKLALLISKIEGFGRPGAIPTVRHNPGDLRHSLHSTHPTGDPNAIGTIPNDDLGWADLERQLTLFASRGMTLKEAIYTFAPENENNSAQYLAFVCQGLVSDLPVSKILEMFE